MDHSERIGPQSSCLQVQKSFTLGLLSHSEWGYYRVAFSFAYKGSQYVGYA